MKIRSYQEDMVKAQRGFMINKKQQRGQIYSPTGSGKTVCFDIMINEEIRTGDKENTKKKICIVYPRIALAMDQQTRLKDKKNVEFTNFHSGGIDAPSPTANLSREQISTTSVAELEEVMETTDKHHITLASYKSFKKIAPKKFDLIICDEAHNLVQSQYAETLEKIESKVIFYTATPINVSDDLKEKVNGMNNEKLFGKVLCRIKPKELIDQGYIVKPLLVALNISTNGEGKTIKDYLAIAHAFNDQKERLTKITNKMLVAMSSTQEFKTIQDNINEMRNIVKGNLDLYSITAGTQYKNGINLPSREAALKDFAENKNQSIILHCDTLAEGIDVPGITGIFLLRGLTKAKFIQTIGRAARPSSLDINIDGEVIDMENRVKPYAIITIAVVDDKHHSNIDSDDICNAFIEGGYGDNVSDITQYIVKEPVTGTYNSTLGQTLTQAITYKEIEKVVANQINLLDFSLNEECFI